MISCLQIFQKNKKKQFPSVASHRAHIRAADKRFTPPTRSLPSPLLFVAAHMSA